MSSARSLKTLETLEATVQPGTPCGEDLEYTSAFIDFVALSTASEERQVGDHVIPAQTPDWAEVFTTGCTLLEQSRDLRILAKVCRAAVYRYGLPGLARGLSLMASWLEVLWDDLHPRLTVDGDHDPLFRSNAIAEISDPDGLIHSLRHAVFLETPVGTVTVSAANQLLSGKPGGKPEGKSTSEQEIISTLEQLTHVVAEEQNRNQERFTALIAAQAALTRITAAFKAQLDSEYWPDISLLTSILSRLGHLVSTTVQNQPEQAEQTSGTETSEQATAEQAPGTADAAAASPSPARAPSAGLPAKLTTRADAFKALQLARKYFEDHEPSHPAPLLIQRVERLAGLDFLELLRDLAPDGLQQLQLLSGSHPGDGRQ
jgi:type VI secretion system protein ImpA